MCFSCLVGSSLFFRCPVLLPWMVNDLWEVQATFTLNFGLIICSTNHMHVTFCLHLVPHALHLCQVNCVWTICGQLCFDLLGYLCSGFKNLIVQKLKSQTRSIPFKMFSVGPPPFPSSSSLTPWTLKQNWGQHMHPGIKGIASASPVWCEQGVH